MKIVVEDAQSEKRRKILEWLSASNLDTRNEELQKARVNNSGEWFLNSEEFKSWTNGTKPSCLICPGIRLTLSSSVLISTHSGRRKVHSDVRVK
jgi:hypothetical protein